MRYRAILLAMGIIVGCASRTVRTQDLIAWQGVPVEALDTHEIFATLPMKRMVKENGTEVRFYVSSQSYSWCGGIGGGSFVYNIGIATSFQNCVEEQVSCNNVFYIRNEIVERYDPVGNCYTNEAVQPNLKYRRVSN